jgi:hypothetical protein
MCRLRSKPALGKTGSPLTEIEVSHIIKTLSQNLIQNPELMPPDSARKSSFIIKGLLGILVSALVLGGVWWWYNRPIQPVQLTTPEKQAVEAKVHAILEPPSEPKYEKGSKEIILTERELNGLLNENTDLGKTLSFQLATNAIYARVERDLDKEIPIFGGKHLKLRARFLVNSTHGHAGFTLDDVTIWGISLPNDWLAGLKGQDLLGQILEGGNTHGGKLPGVEDLKIEPGRIIIKLAE